MNKTAIFKYKCRLCGKQFPGEHTSPELAPQYILHAVYGFNLQPGLIGTEVRTVSTHASCTEGYGIADLIGYVIRSGED